ncbi:DUF1775 domain-containing protein [Amycolatopsis sp. NPDC057786]|uniref:DUF1775 domain-containing protein n=1 Tax=Amycolatopsis sp. NPDC057786 TaxID=3346250 RepID=UPI00366FDA1B
MAVTVAALLLGAGTAHAHVTAHIPDTPPEKGGHGTIVLRVPNEESAATVRLEVALELSYGITTARTRPVAGWDASIRRGDGGVVIGVVWTARPGSEIAGGDEHYEDFGLTLGPLPSEAPSLTLPTTQFLADGGTVAWAGQPDSPAPEVPLAEPSARGHHSSRTASTSSVSWLIPAALLAAALLLIAGGVILVRRREIP